MELGRLPFFDTLADAKTILLAGAGGGFDIYSGIPLYFALRAAGKTVHLANLSFSTIYATKGRRIGEALVEVTADTVSQLRYFPEFHLAQYLQSALGESIPIYCFDRVGARPITAAYRNLVAHLGGVDAVVLVDGGTDSLMRGDEVGLGTPQEDMVSICAVDALTEIATKLLVCIGFGADRYHGICHAQFLEAVAALVREGAFLGAWSLLPEMPEAKRLREAGEWVRLAMFNQPSIVTNSVLSAVEGRFGNYHETYRTEGSELFINPLMSLYWAFELGAVARRNLYLDAVRETESYTDLTLVIEAFRERIAGQTKEWQDLPM